jgi:hypothetical protein
MSRNGVGYIGSSDLQTSTTNQEIVSSSPSGWTIPFKLYKMSFLNNQDCHVKINGGDQIFLSAGQGFEMNENDAPIQSFIIVESGITFNFMGAY